MSKWTAKSVKSTSATEVRDIFNAYGNKRALIRRLNAVGDDAACVVTMYKPQKIMELPLSVAAGASGVEYMVPVDVAGGHVVQGYTVTTSDYIMAETATGMVIKAITTVTDKSTMSYCGITVGATFGKALAVGAKVAILRMTGYKDILATTVGSATLNNEMFDAGDAGMPLIIGATATSGKNCTLTALVEYVD